MVVDHPQAPQDGQVIIAEDVGALQAEQQDHLRCPDADALQAAQGADGLCIGHVRHGVQIKGAGVDFFGKVRDVFRLAESHAQCLQPGDTCGQDVLGVHPAQRVLHPLPDGGLGLGGDLLAHDMVDHGGKQVRVYRAADRAHAVDDLTEPLVLLPQVGELCLPVGEIHIRRLPARMLRYSL